MLAIRQLKQATRHFYGVGIGVVSIPTARARLQRWIAGKRFYEAVFVPTVGVILDTITQGLERNS